MPAGVVRQPDRRRSPEAGAPQGAAGREVYARHGGHLNRLFQIGGFEQGCRSRQADYQQPQSRSLRLTPRHCQSG